MTPILLQRGPEFLKYLDELLIVVFMIAGALLPAIKQAREKKKAEARLKGRTSGSPPDLRGGVPGSRPDLKGGLSGSQPDLKGGISGSQPELAGGRPATASAPSAPSEGAARRSDLEDRVKSYFEQLQGPRRTATPAPPRPPPPPTAKRTTTSQHLGTAFEDVHVDLAEITHLQRVSAKGAKPPRDSRVQRLRPKKRPELTSSIRRSLKDRDAFKRAVLLREILGKPRGLDGL